jgi:hypothetical protein
MPIARTWFRRSITPSIAAGFVAWGIWRSQPSQLCPLSARRCVNPSSWRRCSGGQAVGQPSLELAPRSKAEINTETFKTPRRRNDDPPPAAFFHDQLGQVEEAIVLKGLRMKGVGELFRRAFSEEAEPKPLLAFDGVSLPVALCREIRLDRRRKSVNLLCHEGCQLCRRPLTGSQRTTRIAQIAQHQCATEAVVLAPTPMNDREITGGQRIVADEFTRLSGRIEQRGGLGLAQLLSAHRSCSPQVSHRQTSRSEPGSR